ncbi:Protein PRY2 [Madurella mycetomatis]|uniref:Protein PRY2 n=1 Tax=Madurella mycetomatis TaxID=100816 RepID=A0A175VY83_9PEZI|nr:Protein PRY2 [Madurella mycetomatis]
MKYAAFLAACSAALVVASPIAQLASVEDEVAVEPTDYPTTALFHHNIHRTNHSVDPLAWNDTLAGFAQTLVDTCEYQLNTSIGGGGYGQNVAMKVSSGSLEPADLAVARAITNMWYNPGVQRFPTDAYGTNPPMENFNDWGSFTQVIWRATRDVGCATAFCPSGSLAEGMPGWLTVCNYYPPGNVIGRFANNVNAPLGQDSVSP